MPAKRSLQYVIEKDWKSSPKAQMGLFKASMIGVAAGFVLCLFLGVGPMGEKLDKAVEKNRMEICTDPKPKGTQP